ncbi:MAG: DeoR/GlpR transcriptional regulator [Propionibacterium sp.]|nr:DeoR/GlpR transcriptional regulator [Propionibacterium sp.]
MATAPSKKRSDRMVALLELLQERGPLSLTSIADLLDASAATIRRDVALMASQGLIERTHGGARPLETGTEVPVHLRGGQHPAAKQAIAGVVASLIPAGQHAIGLTGGSTTDAVLRALKGHDDLTIITNSISVGQAAAELDQSRVLIVGGVLRRNSLELIGSLAESTMKLIKVETTILGADGCTVEGGLTTHDKREARTNQLMAERADRVIAAVDSSKLGLQTDAKVVDLQQVDTLVTDAGAPEALLEAIRDLGVEVLVAGGATR